MGGNLMDTIFNIFITIVAAFWIGAAAIIETILKIVFWIFFLIFGLLLTLIYPISRKWSFSDTYLSTLYEWCTSKTYYSVRKVKSWWF